jgi:hypothetical protein
MQSVQNDVSNLRGGGGNSQNAEERVLAYLEWTNNAVRMLGTQISNGEPDPL